MYFCAKFVFLAVRFTVLEHQYLLFLGETTMLLDNRIMDISTIHASVAIGPHMPDRAIEIQEMIPHHKTVAA
jgi:hypothetical protein